MKNLIKQVNLKKLFSKHILLLLVANLVFVTTFAQERTITGNVTDKSGETLVGVSVLVKGTTIGTATDIDGNYSLQVNDKAEVLSVFYIGYLTQDISIKDKSTINFVLEKDVQAIDEVLVVIGYGVQKKKLLTGATAQINGDVLEKRNSTNALQAMQGQVAGVNITSASGQPGEGMKVTIRGLGTIGNASPLYIVDGVQTTDINYLNSADIESIDVLKDAASAAIYGSRAANGVILITTKKGKVGKSQVTFDAYYGVQNVAKKVDMLNTDQYVMIMNEQAANSGLPENRWPFDVENLPAYTQNGVANTDWMDQMFVENALSKNIVVGASGGTEQSIYSMSLSYTGQEGIVGGPDLSNYERYGGRFNSEKSLYNGRIKIGQNLSLSYVKKNGVDVGGQYTNPLKGAFNASPLMPVYTDDGGFMSSFNDEIVDQDGNIYWYPEEQNPYASMVYKNQNTSNNQKVIGNVYADIELTKNLKFRSSIGFDNFSKERRSYTPEYVLSTLEKNIYSKANQRMEKGLSLTFDNVLSYSLNLDNHKIDAMAGMSARQYHGSWIYGENAQLAFNDLEHAYLNNATNQEWANLILEGAPNDVDKLVSYFGRVQYGFKETYLFNATFRADGSSKFADGNRWGYFPSFSTGWVMSNENFMEGASAVNFLKLRASWGQNGNQNIESFQYVAPIQFTDADYNFGDTEGVNTTGSYPNRLPNEAIKWETSEQLNIGFDARLLDSHLSVNFDYYNKTTKDWLIKAPVLATAGAEAPFINGGSVSNKGVELALSYNNEVGDFSYNFNANGAFNKNNVIEIPTKDGIIHGSENVLFDNSLEFYRAESGHPVGFFWGYETDGLFQTQEDVDSYVNSEGELIQKRAKPGDIKYIDQNGDGTLTDDDKVDLGNPNPDFIYGFSFNCTYKAFDFQVVTNGVMGNQIVQSYRFRGKFNNYTTAILDRWTGEGTSNTIPRVTNSDGNYSQFSSIFMQDGDYFRISNLTLGVDLTKILTIKHVSQLRLYASAQNLHTFTKYTGMDPEVGYGHDGGVTDQFSSGIDVGYYPRPSVMLFGVNVKF
ncbi:MAG: TonB-dependent receptor [Prolixibacteraceae bacterium]|jgi:TonB-linked SusC/RagA family outer membrane protein|nr:TonB-dependent receptor [Prolixibacteraceae bacterium]